MRVLISDPNNSLFRKLIINFGLPRLATAGTQDMKAGEPRRIFILLSVVLIECASTGKVMMTMLGCWERNCQWWSQEIRAAGKYWQQRLHQHQGRDVEIVVTLSGLSLCDRSSREVECRSGRRTSVPRPGEQSKHLPNTWLNLEKSQSGISQTDMGSNWVSRLKWIKQN